MITFQNKLPYPMKINIDDEQIVIDEYGEYKYANSANIVDFTVHEVVPNKTNPLGYLFLAFIGFISLVFDFYDSEYLNFRKYLSFPVKARIADIKGDITVILNEPKNSNFATISLEVNPCHFISNIFFRNCLCVDNFLA